LTSRPRALENDAESKALSAKKSVFITLSTLMPATLTKAALASRAAGWARSRAVDFGEGRLNEWLKQGLVKEGVRGPNQGNRPVYAFSWRQYRRVLQLIRFRARGIKTVDELFLQLFLKGYGVEVHEVREPLVRQYVRLRAKLNAFIRSTRADQTGAIPPKHFESLVRSLGSADSRLVAARLVPSPADLVAIIRVARGHELECSQIACLQNRFLRALAPFYVGLLASDSEFAGVIERFLGSTTDEEYRDTRRYFALTVAGPPPELMAPLNPNSPAAQTLMREAVGAFRIAMTQPEFACMNFVLMLRMSNQIKTNPDLLRSILGCAVESMSANSNLGLRAEIGMTPNG
jgi:hypothetical protein